MAILGIGIDLCEVERLRALIERHGDRVLGRLFNEDEASRCKGRRRYECLAGRFAAKEAALKALGTGLSQGIRWRDVELIGGEGQRPRLRLHGRAEQIHRLLGGGSIHVSITHDGGHAAAVVVLERDEEPGSFPA